MSGLFGGGKSTSQVAERVASIQIQTSSYGGCVAIIYGTNRAAGNLIHYDDFKAIPTTTKQKTGKGGGGSTQTSTTYNYTAMIILAVCEGPVDSINRVWRDKEVGSLAGYGFTLFQGNRTQAPWSYLTTKHPAKALGYAGTAIVCASAANLGDTGTLRNHSFEVKGLLAITTGNPGAPDAHPADILPDLLTSPFYGAGWDPSRIGDLAIWRTYCTAAGFFMSPVINEQKEAAAWVKLLLESTNSDPVWSSDGTKMVLKVVPYGDSPLSANGAVYTPNTTPVYDLGPDDFMSNGDDPVVLEILPQADSFNICPVQFKNRALDYNTDVREDPEPVDVDAYGPRKAQVTTLDCITREEHALAISRIKAQRSVECRNRYRFRLGWRFILLEPMDLVTLTEPLLGLDHQVVRIREIEETDDGYLEILAEEWPFGVASATAYTTQSGDGYIPDVNADPGNAAAPVIFEPPLLATAGGGAEVWLATSGGDLWGGCEVHISTDGGSSYSLVGTVSQPARHGELTGTLGIGQNTNLVRYSQDFINAAWSKTEIAAENAVVAPDGTITGQKLVESDQASLHYIQGSSVALTIGQKYTLSIALKAGARSFATIQTDASGGNCGNPATFNLGTGAVDNAGAGNVASMTDLGGGWYRCSVTATATGTSAYPGIGIRTISGSGFQSYLGDGVSEINAWGAQLELGTEAGDYQPTTSSNATGPNHLDGVNSLPVELVQSSQQLVSASAEDRDDLETLLWVGGELLAYRDATLTGPGAYTLTSLRRGAYGTPMGSKVAGAEWARLDEAVFRYALPSSRVGSTIHIKLRSFNVWGGGGQDLAAVPVYTFTPASLALPAPSSVAMVVRATRPV